MVKDVEGLKRRINSYLEGRIRSACAEIDRGGTERAEQHAIELRRLDEEIRALGNRLEEGRSEGFQVLDRAQSAQARRLAHLEAQLGALMSTVNLLARRSNHRARGGPLRVLFLVHYMEAWDSIADVIDVMHRADDFEPLVASIPRRLPGSLGFRDEELTHQRLTALGIPHLRLDGHDSYLTLQSVKMLDPDLILRQSQWDADVPPAFSTLNLGFARLALIPYEVFNLIENVEPSGPVHDTATDSEYHRACWAVFCGHEYVRLRAGRMSPATGAAQWVVTGHPKFARLRAQVAETDRAEVRPFTVLWSAHHSVGESWTRFGLFPTMAPEMISWAQDRPDLHFVFNPPPSLITVLEAANEPLSTEAVTEFWTRWDALPNTDVFLGGDTGTYGELFARSDVYVSDGISMLAEFQVTNRPVVHVAREGHRPFNELGRICQRGWHTVSSTAEARELIERFAAGEPDPLAQAQREVASEVFGDDDGAAARIVAHIRDNWDPLL